MLWNFVLLAQLLTASFNYAKGIIGRDLVLTPKQGLQINGRSIYYKEDSITNSHNQTIRPWERTLKHVTFVTLFTDVAASVVAGNKSNIKEYEKFLLSPYITQSERNDFRFGDILTLANGRLEETSERAFRFVEGSCDYNECEAKRLWALWQVQKIRHRDKNRKFRYEMKFSVSPLRTENSASNIKRKVDKDSFMGKTLQTFIQRDDDYPQNFEATHLPNQHFNNHMGQTNLKQAATNEYRQVTPLPQSTFMHGIFQPHPHFPPLPERLNIGEYVRDYPSRATPKIELFPSILNMVSRNHFPVPTTYRPEYQVKFPRPEVYPAKNEVMEFPERRPLLNDMDEKLNAQMVTHHFHHHFYMPGSNNEDVRISGAHQFRKPTSVFKTDKAETTPSYLTSFHFDQPLNHDLLPPAPQKINFPTRLDESPENYQMQPINAVQKVPLLIYPAPVQEEHLNRNKPNFMQSEPLDLYPVRYSEPDPLYLNLENAQITEQSFELNAPQLEAPKIAQYYSPDLASTKTYKPDSISVQLPPPDKDKDVRAPYINEEKTNSQSKHDLEEKPSQKDHKMSTEESATTMLLTEASQSATLPATTTTTSETITPPAVYTESSTVIKLYDTETSATASPTIDSEFSKSVTSSNSKHSLHNLNFISTSSTETPLRSAASRYRKTISRTTTTEKPVLKWKPRRKSNFTQIDKKVKGSMKCKENIATTQTTSLQSNDSVAAESVAKPSLPLPAPQIENEIYEVLTQKSVSKSVSIKVGADGEEIPVIVDEDNEVNVKTPAI